MSLAPGTLLGRYEIRGPIGAGGMGEVYRATDTQLRRDVAIKVLPEGFAADPDRRARFEREAQAVAALSHPNVVAVFDVGDHGGQLYVVTELLEGETLRERLQAGPLPVRRAVEIAMDVARGLAAAHDKQILHRDLKPENLFLVRDGRVKILDFGLARQAVSATDATRTVAVATDPGTVVGTVGYMAPEQVRGDAVDARSDLFAFGVVLYEMLAGRRAFQAGTHAETMTAILREDPPELATVRPDVPPALARIVRHCLEKSPAARFGTAGDVAFALDALSDAATPVPSGVAVAAAGRAASNRRMAAMTTAGAVLLLAGLAAWWSGLLGTGSSEIAAPAFGVATQLTTGDELDIQPAISPDGRLVAYASGTAARMRVFIRPVTGGRTITLSEDAEAFEFQPRWSPDGNRILYLTQAGVFTASALGGVSERVAAGRNIRTAAWSPDGTHIVLSRGREVAVLALDGTSERWLGELPDSAHSCDWSPDGRRIACVAGNWQSTAPGNTFGNLAPSAIVVLPAGGGPVIEVAAATAAHLSPVWAPDGAQLYFVSNRHGPRDIYVADVAADGQPRGEPRRITTGLGAQSIAFSRSGERLVYATYTARANIWSLPLPASGTADVAAAEPLTTGNQIVEAMRASADGQWLYYDTTVNLNADIYRLPLAGGSPVRVTTDAADDFAPDPSPDGREVAYHSWRTGTRDIYVQPLDGGPAVAVTASPGQESYPRWSPDAQAILFVDQQSRELFVTRRARDGAWGAPRLLRANLGSIVATWVDDRLLAYVPDGGVAVASLDGGDSRVLYRPRAGSTDPRASHVVASDDGRTVYFKSHDESGAASIWSVPASGGTPRLLVRFGDSSRPSIRPDFDIRTGRIFFAIDNRHADIWVADVTRR